MLRTSSRPPARARARYAPQTAASLIIRGRRYAFCGRIGIDLARTVRLSLIGLYFSEFDVMYAPDFCVVLLGMRTSLMCPVMVIFRFMLQMVGFLFVGFSSCSLFSSFHFSVFWLSALFLLLLDHSVHRLGIVFCFSMKPE